MNSTEAAPIGDIISPTTVGFYTSHKWKKIIKKQKSKLSKEKRDVTSHSRDASYINSLPSSAIALPKRIMLKRTQI